MTKQEVEDILGKLCLTQAELGWVLGVESTTIRRWINGPKGVPVMLQQILLAWMKLEKARIPWHPDGISTVKRNRL